MQTIKNKDTSFLWFLWFEYVRKKWGYLFRVWEPVGRGRTGGAQVLRVDPPRLQGPPGATTAAKEHTK